jgi:hypothetical protein
MSVEACTMADDKVAAAKKVFGNDAAKLMMEDDKFNDKEAARVLRRLPTVWQSTMLFVLRHTASKATNG